MVFAKSGLGMLFMYQAWTDSLMSRGTGAFFVPGAAQSPILYVRIVTLLCNLTFDMNQRRLST